jgi:hypothetical protein
MGSEAGAQLTSNKTASRPVVSMIAGLKFRVERDFITLLSKFSLT